MPDIGDNSCMATLPIQRKVQARAVNSHDFKRKRKPVQESTPATYGYLLSTFRNLTAASRPQQNVVPARVIATLDKNFDVFPRS